MVGNTPLVPVSRNRLGAAAKMLLLVMSPAPGTSPPGFWTRGQVNPAYHLLFQLRQAARGAVREPKPSPAAPLG